MAVTDTLRKEHEAIRGRLDHLETVLPSAAVRPRQLRAMTQALAQMLEQHIHEEELAFGSNPCLCEPRRLHLLGDHADERVLLRDIRALCDQPRSVPMGRHVGHCWRLITELREHMQEEERDLYALADQLGQAEPPAGHGEAVGAMAGSDQDGLGLA